MQSQLIISKGQQIRQYVLVKSVIFSLRVTLLVSEEIVFGGDHGMWRIIAYAQCILCDTVGFRRSFWIIRYFCVCTTRPLVSLYCCTAVVDSPLSRCFRRYHRPYPRSNFSSLLSGGETLKNYVIDFAGVFRTHSLDFFFFVRKECFRPT